MKYYTALTIAGSDSCGGAGIQADIKTMSALGVYAASAITAITVQNTKGVYGIQNVEPEIVKGQIEAVMDDIQPDAIKIGMINDRDTIKAIANTLKKYQGKYQHLVIDPVMVSTSGCRLMQEDALDIFISELLPLATLLTPNIPEAEILAEMKIQNTEDIKTAASAISKLGCKFTTHQRWSLRWKRKDRLSIRRGKAPHQLSRSQHQNQQYPRYRLHLIICHHILPGKGTGHEYSHCYG